MLLTNSSARLGYILGAYILAPILIYFISSLFFSRNPCVKKRYIGSYIQNLDTILIRFPKKSEEIIDLKNKDSGTSLVALDY